jgi:hypothetical protein
MARVVELEVIKGLPVSPVRPISVDKPPPPAPVGADAKPAVVVNRGLPGPGMLPTPAAAEYKRTQPPAGRVQMARGAASKATMATQAATAAGEEIKNTTSSAGPKIKFQHGPRRKPLRGGGTVPALALPSQSLSHQSDVPPGAAGDFALPTAEDIALASARDSTKREKSRDSEVEAVRARVAATRLKALQSASNQLTPRVPSRPKTPKEIAIARCGNVSALISSDSDSDVGDQDDQAGG